MLILFIAKHHLTRFVGTVFYERHEFDLVSLGTSFRSSFYPFKTVPWVPTPKTCLIICCLPDSGNADSEFSETAVDQEPLNQAHLVPFLNFEASFLKSWPPTNVPEAWESETVSHHVTPALIGLMLELM